MSKDKQFIGSYEENAKNAEKLERLQRNIAENEEDFLNISELVLKKFNERMIAQKESYDMSKKLVDETKKQIVAQQEKLDLSQKTLDVYYDKQKAEQDATKVLIKNSQLQLDSTNDQIEALKKSIALAKKKNDTMNLSLLDRQITGLREQAKLERQIKNDLIDQLKTQKESMNVGLTPLLEKKNKEESILKILEQKLEYTTKENDVNFKTFKKLKDINMILGRNAQVITNIGLLGQLATSPWLALYFLIESAIKRFIELDKAAEEFRKTTGFTISQTKELRENVEATNRELRQYGVTIDKAYASAKALTDVFQNTYIATKSNVEFVALMKENLGVSVDDSAQVLQNFIGIGGVTEGVAKDTIRIGSSLSGKLGVSFSEVMKDIKSSSKEAALMIGGSPEKLMKAAIQAKVLGTSLGTAARNARSLLNFDESITNELEASVLLGKNINFMNARRLAFEGDIVGSQKEALEVIKQTGDFNSMNVLQREALAKAAGIEVDDISKMLAQEKVRADVIRELEKDKTDQGKANLKAYKDSLEATKETSNELFNQELSLAKNIEKNRQMQGVMTDINNLVEEMKQLFSEVLLPFIGPLITLLVPVLKIVGGILRGIVTGFINPIKDAMKPILDRFTELSGETSMWAQFLENIPKVFGLIGSIVGGLFAQLIKVIDLPTKAIKIMSDAFMSFSEKGPMAIVEGVMAVNDLIIDALTTPFKTVWNYLKETFLGNSPSELGLLIVNGLASVGNMIIDVLTTPFKVVWDYITGIFSGEGQFVSMIKNVGGFIVDLMLTPIKSTMSLIKGFTDAVGITKSEQVSKPSDKSSSQTSNELGDYVGLEQRLDRIITTLNETNNLLKSGAIAVYLDGKKVSRELAISIS